MARGRFDRLRLIESLDPERDHWEIYRLDAMWEFPWDITRALELALYRTFCVPSIGDLLDRTGEFRTRAQRRYDDTVLLLTEVVEHGYDSARGRAAIRRINRVHAAWPISNDDYRYVLSTFVVVPVRWLDDFGWRPLTDGERHAAYAYYRELGHRMGIRDIPRSYDETVRLLDDYERAHFRRSPGVTRTGEATRELFVSWFPRAAAPLVRRGAVALFDQRMLDAFGFDPAPLWLRRLAPAALRARASVERRLPPRRHPVRAQDSRLVRSYPDGYDVEQLGTVATPGGQRSAASRSDRRR